MPTMTRRQRIERYKLGRDGRDARACRRQQAFRLGIDPEHFEVVLNPKFRLGIRVDTGCRCSACRFGRAILTGVV